jgi:diaminohydroxyphosphoribosylaminopyrimidine deaminase / 5-amino-6-(5-phosphoribosylamino)uracil reductase
VHNGKEIARGCTEKYGSRHGERVAFDSLGAQELPWHEITAYVTLEPCSHVGKQPPCVELFTSRKWGRVVIATGDPHAVVNGQGLAKLKSAGIPFEVGLFSKEAIAWNLNFFLSAKKSKVVFAGKWAQTLDGQLADDVGNWRWITGPRSRAYTHWLRQKYDAIVVGARTVLNDFPTLTVRDCARAGQNTPTRIVFDPRGHLLQPSFETKEKLLKSTFAGSEAKFIFSSDLAANLGDSHWIQTLKESANTHLINFPAPNNPFESFRSALCEFDFSKLRGSPLQSVFVEGGPTLLSRFLEADAFDVLHVFIAPFLLGASQNGIAKPMMKPQNNGCPKEKKPHAFPRLLPEAQRYHLLAQAQLENDILLEYLPADRIKLLFT